MSGVFTLICGLRGVTRESGMIEPLVGPGYIGVYAKRWLEIPIPRKLTEFLTREEVSMTNVYIEGARDAIRSAKIRRNPEISPFTLRWDKILPDIQEFIPDSISTLASSVNETVRQSMFAKTKTTYTSAAIAARHALQIPDDRVAVLSIDGGGIRGLIPLALLVRLEAEFPKTKVNEIFDVICGTSTGTIIGAMLAAGLKAEKIREFYEDEMHNIFTLAREGRPSTAYAKKWAEDLKPSLPSTQEFLAELATLISPSLGMTVRKAFENKFEEIKSKFELAPAYQMFKLMSEDRTLRLLGGSPVYNKRKIRDKLEELFSQNGVNFTLGDLAKSSKCVLVFTAVDIHTGATVLMSATGGNMVHGTCEAALTARCVESSMSAPLYFNTFGDPGRLADGGTTSANMPLMSAMLHLEQLSTARVDTSRAPGGLGSEVRQAADEGVFQGFDLHNTTVFSLGCGVTPVMPWKRSLFDISHQQVNYEGKKNNPYGELSRMQYLLAQKPELPTKLDYTATFFSGGLWAAIKLIHRGPSIYDWGKDVQSFAKNMEESLTEDRRFGVGATVNTLLFLVAGLARDAWTAQEDVFRSSLYHGDFRRFQLSLDKEMQTEGLWKYYKHPKRRQFINQPFFAGPGVAANSKVEYQMPYALTWGGDALASGTYNIVSIWKELTNPKIRTLGGLTVQIDVDENKFLPGLAPWGCLSMQWIRCIGERFADAVIEYSVQHNAAFMRVDVVDTDGQDQFVSSTARNAVTDSRWSQLRATLGAEEELDRKSGNLKLIPIPGLDAHRKAARGESYEERDPDDI